MLIEPSMWLVSAMSTPEPMRRLTNRHDAPSVRESRMTHRRQDIAITVPLKKSIDQRARESESMVYIQRIQLYEIQRIHSSDDARTGKV